MLPNGTSLTSTAQGSIPIPCEVAQVVLLRPRSVLQPWQFFGSQRGMNGGILGDGDGYRPQMRRWQLKMPRVRHSMVNDG